MQGTVSIKTGVVGCGAIAQIMHLAHLKDLSELFDLQAICDHSIQLLHYIGRKYSIDVNNRYSDYIEFLASDTDAVFVLTEGSHAPLVVQALRAGKHVFCEKPLCFTVAEAEEIEKIVESSGKVLMVGYMKRYDSGFNYALDIARKIKHPRYTQVTVLHPEEQQYFDIYSVPRFDDVPEEVNKANARQQLRILTNAVGDIADNLKTVYYDAMLGSMIHNVNLIRAFFGEPVSVLSTNIWPAHSCYPTITTMLDYGEAHRIIFTWSYLSGVRNYVEEFSVYSDSERLKVSFSSPFLKNRPTLVSHVHMQNGKLITSEVEVSYDNAFKEELKVFYQCVTTNKRVITDVRDAKADIKLLQLILAAYQPQGLGGEALAQQLRAYKAD
ncbi:putative dehydrogenase [Erwinia toletana]|uniref:Dehydrogenase n=1 Tax=Winslowiella toletana TaxID=92490 RepID=A0ABS4P411_9GAMM|nr:Gfo/Idh/MocA family oxidoreductase [Winslowiella toletana]MBP2167393.1 putative dehydrogenase [Winslowiella toletana]